MTRSIYTIIHKGIRPLLYTLLFVTPFLHSCKKLVEIDPPSNKLVSSTVFSSDASATSAVLGLYSEMTIVSLGFSNGAISIYTGLSSDELGFTGTTASTLELLNNSITVTNSNMNTPLWYRPYQYIYQANACIEGLAKSSGVSTATKNQLTGECKFMRAFVYFYLYNLFGDVPLETSTDYNTNAQMARTPIAQIQAQIIADLTDAQTLLQPQYPTAGVVRANKWSATALLARMYLYQKKYDLAEKAATDVIGSGAYTLLSDLNTVFLANSKESILQLMPTSTGYNTVEGNTFVPSTSATAKPAYNLTASLLGSFEAGDKRFTNWVASKTVSAQAFAYPYKYKVKTNFGSTFALTEQYTLLRYAELYLIRAEARAGQSKITGVNSAETDLNAIRGRAGLGNTTATTQAQMMLAIEQERRIELFAEWGHRWFDLKRTGRADAVIGALKGSVWQSTDQLYPIPASQIALNPTLSQNNGYK